MTWNPKTELAKAASKIAKKEYPNGYTKKQLIEARQKVNGGFSTNRLKRITKYEDINHLRNHMANVDGHYPKSISDCYVVGINGDCDFSCPVFLNGDCEELGEWTKEDILLTDELTDKQKIKAIDDYFS